MGNRIRNTESRKILLVKEFINSRKGLIKPIVKEALAQLVKANPKVCKVYLTGSYANGHWVDNSTPQWFRDFRKSIGLTKEISDVDFYTEPQVPGTEYYDIVPHKRGNSILIYDNSKTKL